MGIFPFYFYCEVSFQVNKKNKDIIFILYPHTDFFFFTITYYALLLSDFCFSF